MAIDTDNPKAIISSFIYWVFVALVPLALSFFFNYYFQQAEKQLALWFPTVADTLPKIFPKIRQTADGAWVSGIIGATIGAIFGCYFARLAITEDKEFDRLWKAYIWFVTRGGTCFNGANLTSADFTSAWVKGADFKNSRITSIIWHKTEALRYARTGNNYLLSPKIRRLVVGGKVASKDFNDFNLEGINLEGKDLSNGQFVNTNLSQANLHNTDLTQANLKHARLNGTNLGKSCLTGAIIENWIIDENTNFSGVKCDFVFMKVFQDHATGIQERMQRMPPQGNFKPGDFERWITPLPGVVDLIIYGSSIAQAVEVAFEKLMTDKTYEFQGFERKGEDFLVKIRVLDNAKTADVVKEYDEEYEKAKESILESPKPLAPRYVGDVLFEVINKKDAMRDLRIILAKLYSDEHSMRRIIDDSDIDPSRISLSSNSTNSWYSILTEASKINRIDALLRMVEKEYGSNEEFQKASDRYRRSI